MQGNRRLIYADQAELLIKNYGKGAIADGIRTLDPVDDIVSLARGVELIPTVDAVEVVRCKDCDWYRDDGSICVNAKCTKSWYGCRVPPEHYCSFGDRRETNEAD